MTPLIRAIPTVTTLYQVLTKEEKDKDNRKIEIVKLLLEKEADVNIKDEVVACEYLANV